MERQTPLDPKAPSSPLDDRDSVNLVEIALVILRGKRTMALGAVVLGLVTFFWVFSSKPYFTASVKILPPRSRPTGAAALMSQAGMSSESGNVFGSLETAVQAKTSADLYTAMLQTRPILDAVVTRFGLLGMYHTQSMMIARNALAGSTKVVPTKEGFIVVSVTDLDRNHASDLANGYVLELRNFMRGLALSEASQRRSFYEGQLEKYKDDLANAELAFKKMQQNSKVLSVDAQMRALIEGASDVRAKMVAKEVELQSLRSYSTDSNPQVQIAERELAALRGQLSQMDVRNEPGFTGVGLNNVPEAELNYVRASRELKYQEALYDLMVKQYETSRIDEARDAPVVQVIEPAIPPERKAGPHVAITTLAGAAVGAFLGFLWVCFQAWRATLSADALKQLKGIRKAAFRW
jgi:uncharacterized protein involved in exopolysaccharide biosynthesis